MLLVALCGGICWLLTREVNRAWRQQLAVARILELGGKVKYAHEFDSAGTHDPKVPAPGPKWLRRVLGDDYFRSVSAVEVFHPALADADLATFARLKSVRKLALGPSRFYEASYIHSRRSWFDESQVIGPGVTDAGFAHLTLLTSLEELSLHGTRISDAGWRRIGELKSLERLELAGANVTDAVLSHLQELPLLKAVSLLKSSTTDAGLKHLGRLTRLERLSLVDVDVSDAGLLQLKLRSLKQLTLCGTKIAGTGFHGAEQFPALRELLLASSPITDAGLAHVVRLRTITELDLDHTEVGDAGLEHLRHLPSLKALSVTGTDISDAGLPALVRLKTLKSLYVGTSVSDEGLTQLRANLKQCDVSLSLAGF